MDEKTKDLLSVRQRLELQGYILGTSFGQAADGPYHRGYAPTTLEEKLLAFADIAGFTKGFDGWMKESLNVFREMSADTLPKDFAAMISGRNGFIGYIASKLAEIKNAIDPAYVVQLSEQLDQLKANLSQKGEQYRGEFEEICAQKRS